MLVLHPHTSTFSTVLYEAMRKGGLEVLSAHLSVLHKIFKKYRRPVRPLPPLLLYKYAVMCWFSSF